MGKHTQKAEQQLQKHREQIEDNKQEQEKLETRLQELQPEYDESVAKNDAEAIERLEKETWTTENRLAALERNLERLQEQTPELESAVDQAKETDRRIALKKEAGEAQTAFAAINNLISENRELFETAAKHTDLKRQIQDFDTGADLYQDYGLALTPPAVHSRTLKETIEYLGKGKNLFTKTDHFTQANSEAA